MPLPAPFAEETDSMPQAACASPGAETESEQETKAVTMATVMQETAVRLHAQSSPTSSAVGTDPQCAVPLV